MTHPSQQLPEPRIYRRLTPAEQDRIYDGLIAGKSYREIARDLDRDEATVRRTAKRDPIRKRVLKHEENARGEARRKERGHVRPSERKTREEAAADRRRDGEKADGKLLGIITIGRPGEADGIWRTGDPRRHAAWLDERDAIDARLRADLRAGWPVTEDGAILVPGHRAPNEHGVSLPYQSSREELSSLLRAGWTPTPEYADLVARWVEVERLVDERIEGHRDQGWQEEDAEHLEQLRAFYRDEIRAEVFPAYAPEEAEQ